MNGLTREEWHDFKDKILELTNETLSCVDFHYLHGDSYVMILYYVTEVMRRQLDELNQEFEVLRDAKKEHAE